LGCLGARKSEEYLAESRRNSPGLFDPANRNYQQKRDESPADPNFPKNQNLEWLVKPIPGTSGIDMFKSMFVVYGVMLRLSDIHPETHPANAWWLKKMYSNRYTFPI